MEFILSTKDNVKIKFVYCPLGNFLMGAGLGDPYKRDSEYPQRKIIFTEGFWITETPITRQQLATITQTQLNTYESSWLSPASQHTWQEALHFCQLFQEHLWDQFVQSSNFDINRRYLFTLPTEAQWEYACRAKTDTIWYFGNEETRLEEHAWYNLHKPSLPAVKLKAPNPWGLFDLYGMVYEWCLDSNKAFVYTKTSVNPVFDEELGEIGEFSTIPKRLTSRIVRGGCMSDRSSECRSSSRASLLTINHDNDLTGFRIVINVLSNS